MNFSYLSTTLKQVLQDVFQVIGYLVKHIFKGALAPITKKRTTMSKVRPIFSPIISFSYIKLIHTLTHPQTMYSTTYTYFFSPSFDSEFLTVYQYICGAHTAYQQHLTRATFTFIHIDGLEFDLSSQTLLPLKRGHYQPFKKKGNFFFNIYASQPLYYLYIPNLKFQTKIYEMTLNTVSFMKYEYMLNLVNQGL